MSRGTCIETVSSHLVSGSFDGRQVRFCPAESDFLGLLDEVAVWSRALDATEVALLYGLGGDSDNDGLPDAQEVQHGTDPTNLDTTPPEMTATVTPTPNANGWNNTNNVSVHFSASNAESGVFFVSPDAT